jgi:pimeloyl-ACP methyl ester carboxylesterase
MSDKATTSKLAYETFDVEVPGGSLHVGRWGTGERVIVAAHGITGNHLGMHPLADQLGNDFTVIAPDLRGRGGSFEVKGPAGMARHADDIVAVMDHAGVDDAVVLGHSMGGFVAVVLAHRAPERVRSLVLVDGGIPLDLPPALAELSVEELTRAIIGPSLDRLRMTFASADAYIDFWRPHPALADAWNDYIEAHYRYDIGGTPPEMRPRVSEEIILQDAGSELAQPDVTEALTDLKHPVVFLRAPRGLFNREPPLYVDSSLDQWRERLPGFRDFVIPDTNHFTILMTPSGARQVAEIIQA